MQDEKRPGLAITFILLLTLSALMGSIAYIYGRVMVPTIDLYQGIGFAYPLIPRMGLPLGRLIAGSPAAAAALGVVVLAAGGLAVRSSSRVVATVVPTLLTLGVACVALFGYWATHSTLAVQVQSVTGGGPISLGELAELSAVEKQLTEDLHFYPSSEKTNFTLTNGGARSYAITTLAPNNGGTVALRDRELKPGESCSVVLEDANTERIYACTVSLDALVPGRKMQATVLIAK